MRGNGFRTTTWVLAALAAQAWLARPAAAQQPPAEAEASVLDRAVASRDKGDGEAAVRVFEIADFQCPYCARFAREVMPRLDSAYIRTGKVHWVFLNLPLHSHQHAWVAAEAALCAGAAGDRFWAMHHRLFEKQQEWSALADPSAAFSRYAAELGVPAQPYRECVGKDQVAPLLLQDVSSVVGAQVGGTPTFVIVRDQQEVARFSGVRSFEEWSTMLDEALARR